MGPWRKSDNGSVLAHQRLADSANRTGTVAPVGEVDVPRNQSGVGVVDKRLSTFVDERWGIVTNAGPDGEDDYENNRYWVKLAAIDGDEDTTDETTLAAVVEDTPPDAGDGDGEKSEPAIITATNRAEDLLGSHALAVDETKWVQVRAYLDNAGQKRWVMNELSLPPGLRGMVLQLMDTENTWGRDFVGAVEV